MPIQSLASIRSSELTESGLFKSVHPLDAPLWADGRNILFREGGPQKELGWTELGTATGTGVIRGADALQDSAGTQRLFFGDQTSLFMWDVSSITQIATGLSGSTNESGTTIATAWSFARFGNWMLATNGADDPQVWKTGSSSSTLAGTTFTTAEIFVKRGPHVLAFNTNNGSLEGAISYEWCDEDDPETWTPSALNAAGNQQIRDLDGPIKAAVNFGQYIAVLGKDSSYIVDYTGAPFYFPYRPMLRGIGAVGKMAVVEANRLLYGVSKSGIWRTDGVSYQYIDTPAIREYLRDTASTSQTSKTVAWHDDEYQMVNFSIPGSAGEPSVTLGWNYGNDTWTIRDWGRSAAVPQTGVFDQPYTFTGRKFVKQNTGFDAHTSALVAYVQTKPMDFGDPNTFKLMDAVAVQIRRMTGVVRLRVGSQKHIDDTVAWSSYITLDDGFEMNYLRGLGSLASGRFLTLEISSAAVGADWASAGFDVYGTANGRLVG